MKRMNAAEIMALQARAELLQQLHWHEWDDLANYIRPSMAGIEAPKYPGESRTSSLFDGTAPQACADLSHYLAAGLTPAASPWLSLAFRQAELNEMDAAVEWLQECSEAIAAEFLRGNFYPVMGEVYADLPTFGNGVPQCEARRDPLGRFDGLHFEAVWLREITALPDEYGQLTITFRKYRRTALQWFMQFGDDVGDQVKDIAQKKPEEPIEFVHAVYPRDPADIDVEGVAKGAAKDTAMPYASVWVNCRDKKIVRESGAMELPRYIVRWSQQSGSLWGFGPGHLALPDIRTLNEAKRLELAAWERNISRPMMTTPNNIVGGKIDTGPDGLTYVRDLANLRPLYDVTDFGLMAVKVDELQASILRTFFADLIREPSDVKSGTTAYEVAKRIERAQRILGEAVGHLRGMLRWAVERSFRIMYREGALPPIPQELLESGSQIDVRYTSPLQQAQEAQGVEQLTLFVGDMAQLAQLQQAGGGAPDAMDWVDFDGAAQELAKRRNAWAKAVRSQRDVEEMRKARAEAQAQQAQQQQALVAGQVARDVGAGAGPEAAMAVLTGG
jgi:hypothetical protein